MTNTELKNIYFGAYSFEETADGWLQAFQYTKEQMDYFEGAFDFWYDRCMASTAKTIEMETSARTVSFDYKIIWKGSEDSFELMIDGLITEIGSSLSHGAVVPREYGLPTIVNVKGATKLLKNGDHIVMDASKGTITVSGSY